MRPGVTVSTILTQPLNYNLVDLADVKTLLGLTGTTCDPFLNLVIPQASQAAISYCNNPFVVEGRQDLVFPPRDERPRTLRGDLDPLQLKRWPLTAVTSVVETIAGVATTLTLGTDFLADAALGQITRLETYWASSNASPGPTRWRGSQIVVQYSAGYATIPADVFDAVFILVKAKYYAQLRDPKIRQQASPGISEATYWFAAGPGGEGDLPADAQAKLQRYRVPKVG